MLLNFPVIFFFVVDKMFRLSRLVLIAFYFERALTSYMAGVEQTTSRLMLVKMALFPLLQNFTRCFELNFVDSV
jgi:hypothetical protein